MRHRAYTVDLWMVLFIPSITQMVKNSALTQEYYAHTQMTKCKHCEVTVSSGGNKPLCVFFHTCVGKPQHLFVWFFHTYVVISTRVCKNTHLCGKNHTDGNCVVCGYYHTHVVKTKHVWK